MSAADLCRRRLEQQGERPISQESGSTADFLGKCYFRGAFQADNNQEFLRRMHLSRSAFEEAASFYEKEHQAAASCKAKSREFLSRYWIQQQSQQRRDALEESIRLARDAETLFQQARDDRGLTEIHLDLLTCLKESFYLSKSWSNLQGNFAETLRIGRIAIREFEKLGDEEGLFESLYLTFWMLAIEAEPILTFSDFQALAVEAKELGNKLRGISEKSRTNRQRSIGLLVAGCIVHIYEADYDKAVALLKEGIEAAEQEGDALTSGLLLWQAAAIRSFIGKRQDHSDERRSILQEAQQLASNSVRNLEISMSTTSLSVALTNQAEVSIDLALTETDPQRKRDRLQEAIQLASKGARSEDHTWAWSLAAHTSAKATYFLALSQTERSEKIRLLGDAMGIRKELGIITEQLLPTLSWDKCVELNYLALIKRELSLAQPDSDKKVQLLDEAVSDMHRCLVIGKEWATSTFFAGNLARYSEWYGDTLSTLHELTGKQDQAENAIRAYQDAADYLASSKREWPLGPIRWKIARVYDASGDYERSSREFSEAAKDYELGARKFAGLASAFEDLSKYMDFWAKVEMARHHHSGEDYLLASESYAEASKILKDTKSWNYLSRLSTARSMLEKGEAMSHLEKHSSSIELFSDSASLFKEARGDMESRLKDGSPSRESDELRYWLSIADGREKYCQGRVLLEEAEALDKKGEKSSSSRKYRAAAETFAGLAQNTRTPRERVEFETLEKFCEALGSMKEGEAKASPKLFSKAADLFIRAKETASGDRFRLLALANAYICKALDAGTRFRLGRDTLLYGEVKKHLETAADYYQEAAFRKAAGWTRATQRLFDSLFCLTAAETEMDRRKKTEYYDQAEKHLESAAKLYGEAGFPAKKLEAVEHLQRAREAKDILSSSMETLAEMPTASGAVLTPLSLTSSQAVGLERFEDANVVGNLWVSNREIVLGSDLEFEVDLANVGRTTATLVKLESLLPAGFELAKEKNPYTWEDHTIDLRGRRLDYLKTFKVKIILQAAKAGVFELRPKVSFADEKGNYRFYQSWNETITVQDPLAAAKKSMALQRVPPVIRIPAEFRFETERSRMMFEYLVKEFLEDYMTKRLYIEKAGWRSLMDVSRELKLPRSAVYASQGRSSPVLLELERRGLVESRIFPEERGRGGDIKRVRIAYENLIVKRLLDQLVMGNQ